MLIKKKVTKREVNYLYCTAVATEKILLVKGKLAILLTRVPRGAKHQ